MIPTIDLEEHTSLTVFSNGAKNNCDQICRLKISRIEQRSSDGIGQHKLEWNYGNQEEVNMN